MIPLYAGERLIGVFDLDSPEPSRFDAEDAAGMAVIAALYLESIE